MTTPTSQFESALKLEKLFCSKAYTCRTEAQAGDETLEMSLGKQITRNDDDTVEVIVGLKVENQNQTFSAEVVMSGVFSIENSDAYQAITEKNTVAIMFPYVRSQMSLITTQPGMSPIIVPAINVNAWLDAEDDYEPGKE
jgi:preprotein translocase subunit SecB